MSRVFGNKIKPVISSLLGLMLIPYAALAEPSGLVFDLTEDCSGGRKLLAQSDFALDLYCDDALGVNAAIVKTRFSAPVSGPYSLSKRTWQGGEWARYLTSAAFLENDKLYIATESYNGSGKIYELRLAKQTWTEIGSLASGECSAVITGFEKGDLLVQYFDCDGMAARRALLDITN